MEQSSIEVVGDHDSGTIPNSTSPPTSASLSFSQTDSMPLVISDDEVEVVAIIKKEKKPLTSVKIESDDENKCSDSKDEKKSIGLEMLSDQKNAAMKGCASPKDQTCSICLSEYDNKSFLDQCFHAFCFYCILQWSEVVRTCPLCKAQFSQIIHSVKSMTEYTLHKLPKTEDSASNTSSNDRRRFRYRTTVIDGRPMSRNNTASSASNAWEQRAERRERLLAMRRRKAVRAKEKRQFIYARNLWVQHIVQTGRTRYRDTSPQFFHLNPACTHRLVPWLTRELQCLLVDEKSHVDFVLQVIMSIITKIPIDSEEFVEQLKPFLSDKTEHFCHEFLSYARSPFDMKAYDDRAYYDDAVRQNTQAVEQTPIVVDTAATGWDSPDESTFNSNLNEPGPSGISTATISNWTPPIALSIEIPASNDLWHDVTQQSTNQQTRNDVIEISPDIVDIPKRKHRHKHKHKHKHKHGHKERQKSRDRESKNSREHSLDPNLARPSTSSTGTDCQGGVIIVSSGHDSSPETRSRDMSSDSSNDENRRKLRRKGKRSKKDYLKSRDHSYGIMSSEHVQRKRHKDARDCKHTVHDTSSPDSYHHSSHSKSSAEARPLSPTEEEMRQEIVELERKIAVDTQRLEELLQKQNERKRNEALSGNNEESENEGLSR